MAKQKPGWDGERQGGGGERKGPRGVIGAEGVGLEGSLVEWR